jgi:hypothetical protein
MTEKNYTGQEADTDVGAEEKRVYQPPSLVRYGPLFFNTQAKTCSEAAQSLDPESDICDPPDADSIGDGTDEGTGKGGADTDTDPKLDAP